MSEVIARTLPYSIFLVGVAFILAFVIGTTVGMIAAWRRGGAVDNVVVPTLLSLSAFPAFFTSLVAVYFFGLKLGWFPLQHAYNTSLEPGFNYTFLASAFRHAQLPILVIMVAFAGGWVLNMRTVMINTIEEDYVAMAEAKGLRDRRVMTRYAGRNAILPPLNGFAAQFATAVGGLVFIEFVFSYPGRRLHAAAGRARQRLPAHAGAAARVRGVRDRRQLRHGHPQPRPRPARAGGLGGARVADPAGRDRGGRAERDVPLGEQVPGRAAAGCRGLPLWLRLLLAQPEVAASGWSCSRAMLGVAIFSPLIATHDPTAYSLLDAKQSPSWDHFFGTTDQGMDIFSQVVLGIAHSLFLGAAAAALATFLAATPRHPRRLQRRLGRRRHQLRDERLPRDPDDPAPDRHHRPISRTAARRR